MTDISRPNCKRTCKRFPIRSQMNVLPMIKPFKFKGLMVGAARFELATPCSQNSRSFADLSNHFNCIAFGEV